MTGGELERENEREKETTKVRKGAEGIGRWAEDKREGKKLTRVRMKGHRLEGREVWTRDCECKGVEEKEWQKGKDRNRVRLKMPLTSCLREIKSRHSVNEEEISHWGGDEMLSSFICPSPFALREILTSFTGWLSFCLPVCVSVFFTTSSTRIQKISHTKHWDVT